MVSLIDINIVCDVCHDDDGRRTPVVESITVAFDGGRGRELDLCAEHLTGFRDLQRVAAASGRPVKRGRKPKTSATGEYVCDECGASFDHPQSVAAHKRARHTGAFTCSECGKQCIGATGLKAHMRVHKGGEDVACPTCGKPYKNRAGLATHLRTSGHGPDVTIDTLEDAS